MKETQIKIRKLIVSMVEKTSNDAELGFAVRKLINNMLLLKKIEKQEKSKKNKKNDKKIKLKPNDITINFQDVDEIGVERNEKFIKLSSVVVSYINGYNIEKIELILEAIKMNFVKEFENDVLISKDWNDSQKIYEMLIDIITKSLFVDSDSSGFYFAQKFCKTYLNENDENNAKGICLYFLKNTLKNKIDIRK